MYSKTTLLFLLLKRQVIAQQDDTPSICLSLKDSKACPAFRQFYVSSGVVDRYPFLSNNITTIQDLDNGLFNYVNSTSDYLLPLGCLGTNYNPTIPYARYALTKMCARLIQDAEDSLPCNTEHNVVPPPLCQSTCLDWVASVTSITSLPSVCSDSLQRSVALANYTNYCYSWQGYNATTDDNCISGFANEPENCGFRDDIKEACQFCQNSTNAARSNCCQLVTCGHGLSAGSVMGIALGALTFSALVVLAWYYLCRHNQQQQQQQQKKQSLSSSTITTSKERHASSTTTSCFSDSKTAINFTSKHWPEEDDDVEEGDTTTVSTSTTTLPSSPLFQRHQKQQQEDEDQLYLVIHAYPPQMDDELTLNIGDMIMVALPFDDGWALGVNMTTGSKGAFPLVCISSTSTARLSTTRPDSSSSNQQQLAQQHHQHQQPQNGQQHFPLPQHHHHQRYSNKTVPKRMQSIKSSKLSPSSTFGSSSDITSPFSDRHHA